MTLSNKRFKLRTCRTWETCLPSWMKCSYKNRRRMQSLKSINFWAHLSWIHKSEFNHNSIKSMSFYNKINHENEVILMLRMNWIKTILRMNQKEGLPFPVTITSSTTNVSRQKQRINVLGFVLSVKLQWFKNHY